MAPIFLEPHMATLEKIVAYLGMKSGLWQIRPRHQYMKQILKTNSYRNKYCIFIRNWWYANSYNLIVNYQVFKIMSCYKLINFRKSLLFSSLSDDLNRNSTWQQYCCLKFPFKFFDKKWLLKRDFLKTMNL